MVIKSYKNFDLEVVFSAQKNEDDRPIILMTTWDLTKMPIQDYEPEVFLMFLTMSKISAHEAESPGGQNLTWESDKSFWSRVYHLLTLRKPLRFSEPFSPSHK